LQAHTHVIHQTVLYKTYLSISQLAEA
jgi:hypothetical protein